MTTICKIRIDDNEVLRQTLNDLYDKASHRQAANFSLVLAQHILDYLQVDLTAEEQDLIAQGFAINRQRQDNLVRNHDVRQVGFAIHRLAKAQDKSLDQTILRVVGQAVASAHMKEHAMVASDYAIKVINLAFPKDTQKVDEERKWQIESLKASIEG